MQIKIMLFLISDRFSYVGDLRFLRKSQVVKCMRFKPHLWRIDFRYTRDIQFETIAVGSDNWHEKFLYSNIIWV